MAAREKEEQDGAKALSAPPGWEAPLPAITAELFLTCSSLGHQGQMGAMPASKCNSLPDKTAVREAAHLVELRLLGCALCLPGAGQSLQAGCCC